MIDPNSTYSHLPMLLNPGWLIDQLLKGGKTLTYWRIAGELDLLVITASWGPFGACRVPKYTPGHGRVSYIPAS